MFRISTYRNDRDGIESRVWANGTGKYTVTLYDIDACETLPTAYIFSTLIKAVEKAREIVK